MEAVYSLLFTSFLHISLLIPLPLTYEEITGGLENGDLKLEFKARPFRRISQHFKVVLNITAFMLEQVLSALLLVLAGERLTLLAFMDGIEEAIIYQIIHFSTQICTLTSLFLTIPRRMPSFWLSVSGLAYSG